MQDPVVAVLNKVAETLAEQEVAPEVTWTVIATAVAEQYGWTVDEASENLANLLSSLS